MKSFLEIQRICIECKSSIQLDPLAVVDLKVSDLLDAGKDWICSDCVLATIKKEQKEKCQCEAAFCKLHIAGDCENKAIWHFRVYGLPADLCSPCHNVWYGLSG